jgi:hypothetical protein
VTKGIGDVKSPKKREKQMKLTLLNDHEEYVTAAYVAKA